MIEGLNTYEMGKNKDLPEFFDEYVDEEGLEDFPDMPEFFDGGEGLPDGLEERMRKHLTSFVMNHDLVRNIKGGVSLNIELDGVKKESDDHGAVNYRITVVNMGTGKYKTLFVMRGALKYRSFEDWPDGGVKGRGKKFEDWALTFEYPPEFLGRKVFRVDGAEIEGPDDVRNARLSLRRRLAVLRGVAVWGFEDPESPGAINVLSTTANEHGNVLGVVPLGISKGRSKVSAVLRAADNDEAPDNDEVVAA
jgi:hypothetical protein